MQKKSIQSWPAGSPCPIPCYPSFKSLLSSASHHFADDSGKEWPLGDSAMKKAASLVINDGLPFWAIKRMFQEAAPLPSFDTFAETMLSVMYANMGAS